MENSIGVLYPASVETVSTHPDGINAPHSLRKSALAEGEGFEPPKACTLVVFKTVFFPFASVRHSSPTFALYMSPGPIVRQRSRKFAIVRRGCRHGCRQGDL
jgi:hypothetical protein